MSEEIAKDAQRRARIRALTSHESLIADAVHAACRSPLATKTRILEGFSNEVYAATSRDGQQVIVRIHWYGNKPHFEAEQWALERCAAIRIPVPRVLFLQHLSFREGLRSICVETRLPGQTLQQLLHANAITTAKAYPLVVAAGEWLAHVHSIQTNGFGRIDSIGTGQAPTWHAFLEGMPQAHLYRAAQNTGVIWTDVEAALLLLHRHAQCWEEAHFMLLHGDFSPQNFLVDDNSITGLIDFEFPRSGDPAWDIAYWDYFSGNQPYRELLLPTSWLVEGYQLHTRLGDTFATRFLACRLQLGLELMSYHGGREDQEPKFLEFIRLNFQRDVHELSRQMI